MWKRVTAVLAWVCLPLAVTLIAKEHPVPLPADFDPAQCSSCHTDKTEGKHIHTAIAMGCGTCHQVETKQESTQVSLMMEAQELCLTCHQKEEGKGHGPYVAGQCTVCHYPHASEFPAQARAATNQLCLDCHLVRRRTGETVKTLGSQSLSAAEFAKIPKIALDANLRLGHPYIGHPVTDGSDPLRKEEPYSCLSCHEPHAAQVPKLLRAEWKDIEICDRCHQAARANAEKP